MKKFEIFTLICLVAASCNKLSEITFPESGAYGINILALPNNSELNPQNYYSIHALLGFGKKSKLKVVLTNFSENQAQQQPLPVWFYHKDENWKVSEYANDVQTFTSVKGAKECDLEIQFSGANGSAKIDIYQNYETLIATKYVTW